MTSQCIWPGPVLCAFGSEFYFLILPPLNVKKLNPTFWSTLIVVRMCFSTWKINVAFDGTEDLVILP